ncbi:MAG TPA: sugar phosphate isomerase/epimerase [Planctomycetota bacterium]|nr:sugar phosphate isomerase/epimerase [Planctomycetota bacterium]
MTNLLSRRDILKWTAVVGSTALAQPATLLAQDKKVPRLSVQLFSVRGDCGKDFDAALKQIAEMGFDGVEFAGYYKYGGDPAGLRKKLDELNLKAAATHIGAGSFSGDNLKKTIDFHRTIGCKFLIVPGDWRFTNADKSKEYADFMNKTAEALKPEGLFTGHHNHTGEMMIAEGDKMWWDLFAERTSKDVVLQQDMGHTMFMGIDPTALVRKYPGRTKTTHIKCRPPKGSKGKKPFVGDDCFDWKAYFTACTEVGGTEWLSLEQEEYPDGKSAMACTKISLNGMKNILKEMGK